MLFSLSFVVVDLDGSSADQMALQLFYNDVGVLVAIEIDEAVRWVLAGKTVDRHVDVEARERKHKVHVRIDLVDLRVQRYLTQLFHFLGTCRASLRVGLGTTSLRRTVVGPYYRLI